MNEEMSVFFLTLGSVKVLAFEYQEFRGPLDRGEI